MTTHAQIVKALKDLQPNAEWTLTGDDFADLVWLSKTTKPTSEEIAAAIANPLPEPVPTIQEKLASVGLSIEELKAALA
jgi:hypothetical protein